MSSLGKRLLSAALFLPLFIAILAKGSPFHFFVLVFIAVCLALHEFYSFNATLLPIELRLFGFLWAAIILAAAYLGDFSQMSGVVAGGVILLFLLRLLKGKDLSGVINETAFLCLSVLYVVFLLSYLILLRGIDYGHLWILLLFFITWGGDTAAYFSGVHLGKRRLYPEISPKKSVEGLIGGFFGGITGGLFFKSLFFPQVAFFDCIIIAAVIGIVGPLGDLTESMLKRASGVKDSGGLIPGHGGLLDRLDSIMFSAPVLYYFAVMR